MKEQNQQIKKTKIIGASVVAIFGLAAILAIAGLANTVGKLDDKVISHTPDAILASAGVSEEETISLPVAYYDQKADPCVNIYDTSKASELKKRQFEWSSCNYHNREVETGLFKPRPARLYSLVLQRRRHKSKLFWFITPKISRRRRGIFLSKR